MHQRIDVCAMYIRPPVNRGAVFRDLDAFLTDYSSDNPIIVCGDFNIDLIDASSDHQLLRLMERHGFRQLVTQATTDYGSLLDHVYTN